MVRGRQAFRDPVCVCVCGGEPGPFEGGNTVLHGAAVVDARCHGHTTTQGAYNTRREGSPTTAMNFVRHACVNTGLSVETNVPRSREVLIKGEIGAEGRERRGRLCTFPLVFL